MATTTEKVSVTIEPAAEASATEAEAELEGLEEVIEGTEVGGAGGVLSMLVAPGTRHFVYLLIATMTLKFVGYFFSFELYLKVEQATLTGIRFAILNVFGGIDRLTDDFITG